VRKQEDVESLLASLKYFQALIRGV
jgi:hypothetical protein